MSPGDGEDGEKHELLASQFGNIMWTSDVETLSMNMAVGTGGKVMARRTLGCVPKWTNADGPFATVRDG